MFSLLLFAKVFPSYCTAAEQKIIRLHILVWLVREFVFFSFSVVLFSFIRGFFLHSSLLFMFEYRLVIWHFFFATNVSSKGGYDGGGSGGGDGGDGSFGGVQLYTGTR